MVNQIFVRHLQKVPIALLLLQHLTYMIALLKPSIQPWLTNLHGIHLWLPSIYLNRNWKQYKYMQCLPCLLPCLALPCLVYLGIIKVIRISVW